MRAAGFVAFFCLVGGEVKAVLQESYTQPEVTILNLGGSLSSYGRGGRYCSVCSLRGNQDPAPRLNFSFLTTPLFLQPLSRLISTCLNPPCGTQGKSRRLDETCFLRRRRERREAFVPRRAPQGPARFQWHGCLAPPGRAGQCFPAAQRVLITLQSLLWAVSMHHLILSPHWGSERFYDSPGSRSG